jgi:predicted RNA binding protein YcfA (HicA-like mRNA interferase family)
VLPSKPRESDPRRLRQAAHQGSRRPRLVRQAIRGSHHILRHPTIPDAIPVPVHGNQPIKKGTLGNILRTAGISREEFNRLA